MIVDKASPLFETLGGMHIIHVNSTGEAALKTGGSYPDGTIFLDDLHEFTVFEGSYVEGPLKAAVLMTKDKEKYAATGGWGCKPGLEVLQRIWRTVFPARANPGDPNSPFEACPGTRSHAR